MNILVTGSTGFIANNLINSIRKGNKIYCQSRSFQNGIYDEKDIKYIKQAADKPYSELDKQLKWKLKNLKISVWDIIQANSGGHKCITNISGLNYLKEPVKATKLIQQDFVKLLKQKVKEAK